MVLNSSKAFLFSTHPFTTLKLCSFHFHPLFEEVLSPSSPSSFFTLSFSLYMPGSHLGRLIYFGLIKHVWEPLLPHMGFDLLHRAAGLGLGSPPLSSLSLSVVHSLTLCSSVSFHLQHCPALKHCLFLSSQRRSSYLFPIFPHSCHFFLPLSVPDLPLCVPLFSPSFCTLII